MQGDFEKLLKKSKIDNFVSVDDGNGEILYSFAFRCNIYLATYKNSTKFRRIKIQRVGGILENGDKELQNLISSELEKGYLSATYSSCLLPASNNIYIIRKQDNHGYICRNQV